MPTVDSLVVYTVRFFTSVHSSPFCDAIACGYFNRPQFTHCSTTVEQALEMRWTENIKTSKQARAPRQSSQSSTVVATRPVDALLGTYIMHVPLHWLVCGPPLWRLHYALHYVLLSVCPVPTVNSKTESHRLTFKFRRRKVIYFKFNWQSNFEIKRLKSRSLKAEMRKSSIDLRLQIFKPDGKKSITTSVVCRSDQYRTIVTKPTLLRSANKIFTGALRHSIVCRLSNVQCLPDMWRAEKDKPTKLWLCSELTLANAITYGHTLSRSQSINITEIIFTRTGSQKDCCYSDGCSELAVSDANWLSVSNNVERKLISSGNSSCRNVNGKRILHYTKTRCKQ